MDGDPDELEIDDQSRTQKSVFEIIHYEWEEELDEYDEPDVYPSEKDYKWFEEQVTDDEEDEEQVTIGKDEPAELTDEGTKETEQTSTEETGEGKEEQETKSDETETKSDEKKPEEATSQSAQATTEEDKEKSQQEAPVEDGVSAQTTTPAKEKTPDEQEEQEEEFIQAGEEHEEEEDTSPKKKYKTVMVRKLVERPPKIYHQAKDIRKTDVTDCREEFTRPPFRFVYSFGYDCQRLSNLIVLDADTLMFMSGFVITFFNHKTLAKTYLKALGGGSFGSIALHPSRKLFAAAEKGDVPIIGIWSWPKLQIFRILQEGTTRSYASVNFSPDGKLLASQGGDPDYLITVWNWLSQTPILRVKSHVQDVYRSTFSKELSGLLTTSGLCHIKFWKMARTFTGLKLKGDIGRFGRTEISDIEGYVEMPDGKVLSGTEWGNLLVWENGLVIAELCMVNNITCHAGIVRQLLMVEGDFFTTGQDGRIKVWRFEDVDTAEIHTTGDTLKVSLKPVSDVQVSEDGDIWSVFQDPFNNDDMSVFWFAQDGMGHILQVDLSFLSIAKEPRIVLTAHGGPIADSALCQNDNMIVTIGHCGKVLVTNYFTQAQLAKRNFSASGSCILWPSQGRFKDGITIIAGFVDGVLRVMHLVQEIIVGSRAKEYQLTLLLRQVYKPHRGRMNYMSLDSEGEFLLTAGEDGTVFAFHAAEKFTPLAFFSMPELAPAKSLFWSKSKSLLDQKIFIVICDGALIQEVEMPTVDCIDNERTYEYAQVHFLRSCRAKSIKSILRHNEELDKKQKEEEAKQQAIERENQRLIDEGKETKEEQDARLLEEAYALDKQRMDQNDSKKQKKWEPYFPPKPSPILLAYQDKFDQDVIRFTTGSYDAGYVYSVRLFNNDAKVLMGAEADEPVSAVPIDDPDDIPVNKIIFMNNGNRVMFGFENGRVRICNLSVEYDLDSIRSRWTTGMHDVTRGKMTSINLDSRENFMFTTGIDGNCFMHTFLEEKKCNTVMAEPSKFEVPAVEDTVEAFDIVRVNAYTLEDSKNVEKEKEMLALARKMKIAKREKIAALRQQFSGIIAQNNELPLQMRLTSTELTIVSDTAIRTKERYEQALEILKKEMAWHCAYVTKTLEKVKSFYIDRVNERMFFLKAFLSNIKVSSFRIVEFPPFFEEAKRKCVMGDLGRVSVFENLDDEGEERRTVATFHELRPKRAVGMDKFIHQKLVRIWERKKRKFERKKEWDDFLKTDPSGRELDDAMASINEARMQIGDMKLKMDKNYKVPNEKRLTVRSARNALVVLEELMFSKQSQFNKELLGLRANKVRVINRLMGLREKIKECQDDLPVEEHCVLPPVPVMTPEEDPDSLVTCTREEVLLYQQKIQEKSKEVEQMQRKAEVQKRRKRSWNAGKVEIVEEQTGPKMEEIVIVPSPLEIQISLMKVAKARSYQKYYVECIRKEKYQFDARLKLLRHKKVRLDYNLKRAEARMITLTEEFILAQKSVTMEAKLEEIVNQSTKEKRVCTNATKTLQKHVDSIKKQLESISNKKHALAREVQEIASQSPNYEKYLIRVFKKKITTGKKAKKADDESSEDSDDSDDSDDMDVEEEEEDDDGLDVDLPPPDLKDGVYDAVIEVRNRRTGLDTAEIKAKTTLDELMTQINGYRTRMNTAENTLQRTKQELDKFNLEKQTKLNSMEACVSINLHQMFYMHTDLDEGLVIGKSDMKRLRDRIPELKKERMDAKKRVYTTKQEYYRLLRSDKQFKQRLDDMDKKCDEEMLLKFGKVKPIEELETLQEHHDVVKMRAELDDMQKRHFETLASLDDEIRQVGDEVLSECIEQYKYYRLLGVLHVDLNTINNTMDAGLSVMPKKVEDTSGELEIQRLWKIIYEQRRDIQLLKYQIGALTCKSNCVPLPPIQRRD